MKNKKRQKLLLAVLLLVLVALLLLPLLSACAPKEATAASAQELAIKGINTVRLLFFIQVSLTLGLFAAALILAIIIMVRKWL